MSANIWFTDNQAIELSGPVRRLIVLFPFVAAMGTVTHCRGKSDSAKPRPGWLSEAEFAELKQAGSFLTGLQRADGSLTAEAATTSDSAIGQTGYAVRVLAQIDEVTGGFSAALEKGRAFLSRRIEPNGLWKYKPFLPADLDDTTAAFAALDYRKQNEQALRRRCAASVVALQDKDGGLRTWLVTEEAFRQIGLNAAAFRVTERHPEVMAYFFEALLGGGMDGFEKNLDSAAAYLAAQQQADGRWKTTWYRSDLYAVYRVHRFLSATEKYRRQYAQQLQAAEKYALAARLPDGGWGKSGKPSVIDAAFGVGILAAAARQGKTDLARALTFIRASRLPSGGWPAEPFFFLDISQRSKTAGEPVFIGSELYSTAIVAESLMLFYRSRSTP